MKNFILKSTGSDKVYFGLFTFSNLVFSAVFGDQYSCSIMWLIDLCPQNKITVNIWNTHIQETGLFQLESEIIYSSTATGNEHQHQQEVPGCIFGDVHGLDQLATATSCSCCISPLPLIDLLQLSRLLFVYPRKLTLQNTVNCYFILSQCPVSHSLMSHLSRASVQLPTRVKDQ